MQSNFLLGKLRVTENVAQTLGRQPFDLVARHAVNEHGAVTSAERRVNKMSMETVGRIISRYPVNPTDPKQGNVLIITEEGWGSTLVKLEGENQ